MTNLPANETSQVKLLERDVHIQFMELRKCRDHITRLESENKRMRSLLNDFAKEVMDLGISNPK